MERIATGVSKNDYFGMGLCDKGVMYGVPSFIKTAEAIKKPSIIGIEVEIENDTLCLYAINLRFFQSAKAPLSASLPMASVR